MHITITKRLPKTRKRNFSRGGYTEDSVSEEIGKADLQLCHSLTQIPNKMEINDYRLNTLTRKFKQPEASRKRLFSNSFHLQ